jgi:hypothetical protein
MKLRLFIAGLLIGAAAFAADTGPELFQKAVTQERAAGNLEEAIKLYQRVAKEFPSDRALAAKALVAEARCYEKLGQDKATKLYEQVAHDYKDQREPAATANARLAALRQGEHATQPATMTQRRIELPDPVAASGVYEQTDGQRVVFTDSATGALVISDVDGRDKRVIYRPKGRTIGHFLVSRDFSLVIANLIKPDLTRTYATVRTDGTGFHELAGDWHECSNRMEVSWDDRYLLFCQPSPGGPPQLTMVSIAGGEIRKIREADGSRYRFSPDGRFIAYMNSTRQIFVVPSQGGDPQLIEPHHLNRLIDWTRDGSYLLTCGSPGGAEALGLLPVRDGRSAGSPVLVRYGNAVDGRTTSIGTVIYSATPEGGQLHTMARKAGSGRSLTELGEIKPDRQFGESAFPGMVTR